MDHRAGHAHFCLFSDEFRPPFRRACSTCHGWSFNLGVGGATWMGDEPSPFYHQETNPGCGLSGGVSAPFMNVLYGGLNLMQVSNKLRNRGIWPWQTVEPPLPTNLRPFRQVTRAVQYWHLVSQIIVKMHIKHMQIKYYNYYNINIIIYVYQVLMFARSLQTGQIWPKCSTNQRILKLKKTKERCSRAPPALLIV